ncbi:fumarylacetoacetate hydrolase family protein [Sinobaca sp. H24]|uniref:fumarylacetoacetate hydrolase family protein n=1 Tax=Sinobaca sp. H24 TaxID=2923376 RepID=UPI00207A36F9|nr:fumarylacetoacetate hydrolase family protein [Sinobaca sp. H24]
MKIVQFYKSGYIHLGIKKNNRFFDITSANRSGRAMSIANSTLELVKGGKQEIKKIESIYEKYKDMDGFYIEENEIVYAPCISSPEKVICIGLNYAKHAKESGMEKPQEPIVFSKFANTLAGHQENIKIPIEAKKVDYEAELAIVIGEKARNIDENDASEYIYGYCVSKRCLCKRFTIQIQSVAFRKKLRRLCSNRAFVDY